jgi:hypothetical protein
MCPGPELQLFVCRFDRTSSAAGQGQFKSLSDMNPSHMRTPVYSSHPSGCPRPKMRGVSPATAWVRAKRATGAWVTTLVGQ